MVATLFVKDARLRPFWRVLIYALAVPILAAVLFDVYSAVRGHKFESTFTLSDQIAVEFITAATVLLVSLCLRRYLDRRSIASLGFALRGPWLRLFGLGILFGAAMQAVASAIELWSGCSHLVGHGSLVADLRIVAISAGIFLAAAFLEEMSFRGYVLQNLWEEWGIVPAVVLTSVGFAAIHYINPHASDQPLLTIAGLITFALWACMSLLWTKSLWLALGVHAAWNVVEGPVLGLPVSGVVVPGPTVLAQSVTGPAWLTGGSFGPEAGISSLVALALGFAALRFLHANGAFADAADTREAYARNVSGSFGPSSLGLGRS